MLTMEQKTIEAEAVAIDDSGKGIIRTENRTLFVTGLLPGEKGQVRLTYIRGKIAEATLIRRLSSAKDRVIPPCPYYESCGGCALMHLSYEAQLKYKQEKVRNLLHKFARLDVEVNPTVGMDEPFRFRNKVQVPVRKVRGRIVTGFFKEGTHEIVPIDDCLVQSEKATEILRVIRKLMDKYDIEAYDEDRNSGLIRHILIKESHSFNEAMVVLVTTREEFYGKVNLAKEIIREVPEVKTVVQNINSRHTNVILGEREDILAGSGKIKDSVFGLTFLISSKSFYQTNPVQTERLYDIALRNAQLSGKEEVLDAYSGTGTIGLSAAKSSKHVTCVEIVPEAIRDARQNARINKIENVSFVKADCTDYLTSEENIPPFDVVFMDPPRKGSTPEFLNALSNIKPKKIIYISCNPVTLARDLSYLKDIYDIDSVTPVDMFPQTAHVETVVCLSQRKSDETIKVEVDGDALPVTKAETKATYEDIQKYILDKYGVKVSSLDISRVKTKCGIKERKNYNLSKSNYYKQPGITDEKEGQILDALRLFKMV